MTAREQCRYHRTKHRQAEMAETFLGAKRGDHFGGGIKFDLVSAIVLLRDLFAEIEDTCGR